MTTDSSPITPTDGLALLLGARQAEVMRLFWAHGPATVREIYERLKPASDLAYTTVATVCVRLAEKGLLKQERGLQGENRRHALSYIYTALISEEAFMRQTVGCQLDTPPAHDPALTHVYVVQPPKQKSRFDGVADASDRATVERVLAYLASLRNAGGERADDAALDVIAHLLERAEAATRRAAVLEREAQRAQQQAQKAVAREEAALRQAATREDDARRALDALEAAAMTLRQKVRRHGTLAKQRQAPERRRRRRGQTKLHPSG